MKKKTKPTRTIQCMPIYGRKCYFKHYLINQIGGTWGQIKDNLYAEGYTATEVNDYRNDLLEDFWRLCKKNNLKGIV